MDDASARSPEDVHSWFEYFYRDASNYKAHGRVLLCGGFSTSDLLAIQKRLFDGEFFVAEQVGIPTLFHELTQYSGGWTEDDHSWHSFLRIRPASQQDVASSPVWGDAAILRDRFLAIERWNS